MPIPQKWWIPEEVAKEHWFKEVIWETIVDKRVNGVDVKEYQKFKFNVKSIGKFGICSKCITDENTYLISMPAGVYKACVKCAATGGHSAFGPLPIEEGKGREKIVYAKLLESRILETSKEIAEVASRLNWTFDPKTGWHY